MTLIYLVYDIKNQVLVHDVMHTCKPDAKNRKIIKWTSRSIIINEKERIQLNELHTTKFELAIWEKFSCSHFNDHF